MKTPPKGGQAKELGTVTKKILYGKKIDRINCLKTRKVKKLISNGRSNLNFLSLKQGKSRIRVKLSKREIVGLREESSDMDGNNKLKSQNYQKTIKLKQFKRNSKRNLSRNPKNSNKSPDLTIRNRFCCLREDVYERKGIIYPEITFRKGDTKGKLATRAIPVIEELRILLLDY